MGRSRKRSRNTARSRHEAVRKLMDYDALFLEQDGKCGICGRENDGKRRFDRDHDHKAMTPRGLLCRSCNRKLRYDITLEWMTAAIKYLRRFQ